MIQLMRPHHTLELDCDLVLWSNLRSDLRSGLTLICIGSELDCSGPISFGTVITLLVIRNKCIKDI